MYLKMMLSNAGTLSSELSTKSFVLQASVRALIKRNWMNERTKSMEQSLSWKWNSRRAGQEIAPPFMESEVRYGTVFRAVHLPLDRILNTWIQCTSYFLKTSFIIISSLPRSLWSVLPPLQTGNVPGGYSGRAALRREQSYVLQQWKLSSIVTHAVHQCELFVSVVKHGCLQCFSTVQIRWLTFPWLRSYLTSVKFEYCVRDRER
jgi:hypothetical protein